MGRSCSLLNRPEHSFSLSYIPVSNSSPIAQASSNSTLKQSAMTSQSSVLPVHSTLSETRHSENVHLGISSVDWKTSPEVGEEFKSSFASRSNCRFPGSFGPVFDIQVVKGQMYVGHINRCVRVYSLNGLYQVIFVLCFLLHVVLFL